MRAVVVALGKVGLPLAAKLTLAGHDVVGCDIDPHAVKVVAAGRAPFPGERGLDDALASAVADGRLTTSTDTAEAIAAHHPELIVAVPPLYVNEAAQPTWDALDSACADIGRGLAAGALERKAQGLPLPVVAIETTVPATTTRRRLAPAIEATSGLRDGEDFHTVFSPERVFTGRSLADLDAYPKLVGGLTSAGEQAGVEAYRRFLTAEVRAMGSAEAAELAKLAETTYRDINIAFANELARYSDDLGIDVLSVIEAANSQPYSHIHRPGVAVGGHCIPVYPRFLSTGNDHTLLARAGREVNDAMPAYAASLLGDVSGKRVLILGVAYRGGVRETAFSGAFALQESLREHGATVLAQDPLYDANALAELGFDAWDGLTEIDAVVVQADHPGYRTLTEADLPGAETIVDGRGVLDPTLFSAVPIKRIGRPDSAPADGGSDVAPSADRLDERPA